MHSRTSRATLGLTAALAGVLLAGCGGLPTSGPVRAGDVAVEDPGVPIALAADPVVDGAPEVIVGGFLSAGAAGLSDDFQVARKYLTSPASVRWQPRARVLVYPSQVPDMDVREDGSVVVTVSVAGVLDAAGVYVEAAPGAREEYVLTLVQDLNEQWRIANLDDGVLMSARAFEQEYRAVPIYFSSPDRAQLVPDLRWFPAGKTVTSAVDALLEGPSTWLRDAVISGVPEGSQLASTVVVEDNAAQVDIVAQVNLTGGSDRDLLQAQLDATLGRLAGVVINDVEVSVGGVPWPPGPVPELDRDIAPLGGPYLLVEDQLAVVERGEVVPVPDVADLDGLAVNNPAIGLDGRIRVALSGTSRLLLLPREAGEPVELLRGRDLVPPTVDRFGYVWSGPAASNGTVAAVTAEGEQVSVGVGWLDGRTVRSMRVSRDGTRIAVISVGEDERVSIDVAGVVRDERGQPQRVGERWQVGASLTDAVEVSWVDEVTLAVLGQGPPQQVPAMHLVSVGGPTESLPPLEQAIGIATGRGDRTQYLVDAEETLFLRQTSSWAEVATGVRDAVFPG